MLQSGDDIKQTHQLCKFDSQSVVVGYHKAVFFYGRSWPKPAPQKERGLTPFDYSPTA
jgi:hypothetical protein